MSGPEPTVDDDPELAALLKEQAEFLRSGKAAAAKVSRVSSLPPRLPVLNPDAVMAPKKAPAKQAANLPPGAPKGGPASAMPTDAARQPAAGPVPVPVMTEIREREPVVGVARCRSAARLAFRAPCIARPSPLPRVLACVNRVSPQRRRGRPTAAGAA